MRQWVGSLTADEQFEAIRALVDPDAPHWKLIDSADSLVEILSGNADIGTGGLPA